MREISVTNLWRRQSAVGDRIETDSQLTEKEVEEGKKVFYELLKVYEFLVRIQRPEYVIHQVLLQHFLEDTCLQLRGVVLEAEIEKIREKALQASQDLTLENSLVTTVLQRATIPLGIFKEDMRVLATMFVTTGSR